MFVLLAPSSRSQYKCTANIQQLCQEYKRSRTPLEVCALAWKGAKFTLKCTCRFWNPISLSLASMVTVQIIEVLAKGLLWWLGRVVKTSATNISGCVDSAADFILFLSLGDIIHGMLYRHCNYTVNQKIKLSLQQN